MTTVWLIGGTQESSSLAAQITQRLSPSLNCLVTVTTAAAQQLYPASPNLQVCVGILPAIAMPAFIHEHQICGIVDASHPFATQVSSGAIQAAQQQGIPYLRYERPALAAPALCPHSNPSPQEEASQTLKTFPSLEQLLATQLLARQRVLLVLGYRLLPQFQSWQTRSHLFARILPSPIALETALASGFSPDRLIALRPPVSYDLEKALWQHWQISLVVAKASGPAGGEDIKRKLAMAMGIPLILLERPPLQYPQQTSDLNIVLSFCQSLRATANPCHSGERLA